MIFLHYLRAIRIYLSALLNAIAYTTDKCITHVNPTKQDKWSRHAWISTRACALRIKITCACVCVDVYCTPRSIHKSEGPHVCHNIHTNIILTIPYPVPNYTKKNQFLSYLFSLIFGGNKIDNLQFIYRHVTL